MDKRTTGNWQTHPMMKDNGLPYAPITANTLIAKVYSTAFGDDEQAIANARLMAAAPELFDALESVTRILEAVSYTTRLEAPQRIRLEKAKAALKKARGE